MDEVCMDGYSLSMLSDGQISQRLKAFSFLGMCIIALSFLYFFNPSSSLIYPPCPFHALTGFYCPGCGSMRALYQVLHGHLLNAFGYNPLMILSLPFLGYSFLAYFFDDVIGTSFAKVFIPASCIWIYLGVVILFWILRNISYYPFSLLAP
jgi:hypothetical protein